MTARTPTEKLLEAVATLTDEVTALKREQAETRKEVAAMRDLVEAWSAVKTMGRFLKWAATMGAAITGLWLLMKVGAVHLVGGGK